MSTYRLDQLFAPKSVALIGASPRTTSVGRAIWKNLRISGFAGSLHVVNPRYPNIDGVVTVPSIAALPTVPDLVVVAAPAAAVSDIVEQAGEKGCPAAVIVTAGLGHGAASFAGATERAARRHGLRLIGPNCLGIQVPSIKLNASFAASMPKDGDLALISQSGAIVAGMVEWASRRSVGFSAAVSIGDMIDVDFGDLLDYFATNRATRAILLYVEAIKDARKFMSAARAAARAKPVVVNKAGRQAQGALAARTHTGALAGSDAVYDAVFRRAGLLRVFDLDELFSAAETLGHRAAPSGRRLAILTNGGGIGVLAVDRLIERGGELAVLTTDTTQRLNAVMPAIWSGANPVDMAGDADGTRYSAAMQALLADAASDAVLVMNVPTALASAEVAAAAVAAAVQDHRGKTHPAKPIFAVWVGGSEKAAATLETADIPHYETESEAIQGFMHRVRHREAIDTLMQAPPSLPQDFTPDRQTARQIVERAVAENRPWLDPIEVTQLLTAYSIPIAPAKLAKNADQAVDVAAPFLARGGAVVAKIMSPDIVHKSDIGGVRLGLSSEREVREATATILERAQAARPDARIAGVTIHPIIQRPNARELIAGIADDPTFGPVILFGHGGTAVEVIDDKALALPPLDLNLARDLISRTRISRLLRAYRDVPAADEAAVALTLVKLAQLAADLPEIRDVDLNPLLADETGVVAVDARVRVAAVESIRKGPSGHPRFAIRPYPKEWERHQALSDGAPILLRPVRPEDEGLYPSFFAKVSGEDLRLRFFAPVKDRSHLFFARFTQLDYARAMAFLALNQATGEMLGVVRLHADSNYESGEYAVLVRSDLKGRGLGWLLMQTIIEYARSEGLKTIGGQVLRENTTMLKMCSELGFAVTADKNEPDSYLVRLRVAN